MCRKQFCLLKTDRNFPSLHSWPKLWRHVSNFPIWTVPRPARPAGWARGGVKENSSLFSRQEEKILRSCSHFLFCLFRNSLKPASYFRFQYYHSLQRYCIVTLAHLCTLIRRPSFSSVTRAKAVLNFPLINSPCLPLMITLLEVPTLVNLSSMISATTLIHKLLMGILNLDSFINLGIFRFLASFSPLKSVLFISNNTLNIISAPLETNFMASIPPFSTITPLIHCPYLI